MGDENAGNAMNAPNAPNETTAAMASAMKAIPGDLTGYWCVAHTKPRQEKLLSSDLETRGVFHYLPLCSRMTRSKNTGRVSQSRVPVFPGYLFYIRREDQWNDAMMTNRIVNTLPVSNQTQFIGQLRQIHHMLDTETDFERGDLIKVGQWAKIATGPLMGLEGIVRRRLSRLRLGLNVEMLGQSISVNVAQDALEMIDAPSYRG